MKAWVTKLALGTGLFVSTGLILAALKKDVSIMLIHMLTRILLYSNLCVEETQQIVSCERSVQSLLHCVLPKGVEPNDPQRLISFSLWGAMTKLQLLDGLFDVIRSDSASRIRRSMDAFPL